MAHCRTLMFVGGLSVLSGVLAGAVARESDAPPSLEMRARKYLEVSGILTAIRAQIDAEFEALERAGSLPPRFMGTFREQADEAMAALLALIADRFGEGE